MDEDKKTESFAEMLAEHDAQSNRLEVGQKVTGRVIEVSGDDVFINVGIKLDGVMDCRELLDNEGKCPLKPGDPVEAFVIGISSEGVRLSRSMSGSGMAALEDAQAAGVPVEGRVKGACKGGYQVEVMGKIAFCPGSQMEMIPGREPDDLAGMQMQFLVTRVENHGRNIVVSRRALIERERRENLDKLLSSLKIGDTVESKVTRLAPFGAFVELAPAVEGMIHLSELSWSRVGAPDEAVSVGDEVRVKVLDIGKDDKGRLRISLSRKQAQDDPWETVGERFKPGDIVKGTVKRLAPFGAFVEIAPGVEGLVHLSEMSWEKRVNKAEDVLEPGEAVEVTIKEINPDSRRVSLSLRDALGDPWADAGDNFKVGQQVEGTVESKSAHGLFITLAPGITGLLPTSAMRNAANASQLSSAQPGGKIAVVVQRVDPAARRISLVPVDSQQEPAEDDKSWRGHTKTGSEKPGGESGIMAEALQKALQNRKKGV